jgi:hypothetical protein
MVRVTINGTEYKIKTAWEEVNIEKLLTRQTFRDELEHVSDIPRETINLLTDDQLFPFYTLTSFLDDMEAFEPIESVSVADSKYEQLELAKRYLKEGRQFQKVYRVGQVYYPDLKNTSELLGHGINIIGQIATFLANYEEMIKEPVEPDHEAAGIEELSAFGAFGTAFSLAGEDILKLDDIMETSALRIYTALYFNWKKSKFQQRLMDIKHPKKT